MGKISGMLFVGLSSRSRSEVKLLATDDMDTLESRRMAVGSPFLHQMLISEGARSSLIMGIDGPYLRVTEVKT